MIGPRAALEAIGQIPEPEIDLAGAALQLARVDRPEDDWQAGQAHLSDLARDAASLAADRPGADPASCAGMLAGLIHGRYQYRGDTETYDDPANANLIQVVARRRGLPVALGILWLHCARAAGWDAHGVDFPGHFLVALPQPGHPLVLDVFAGGAPMDARALRGLLRRMEGQKAELRPGLLRPMSSRAVLLRLQNNIKARRLQAGDQQGALAALEDMLRIAPEEPLLWQEAAMLNQHLDHVGAALRCLDRFLALAPEGEAAMRARTIAEDLRTRLN